MIFRNHRGFTLIELLIALAIAALLLVLAAPGLSRWIADSEIQAAAQSVASGLRTAQAEAIKQNTNVQFVLTPAMGTGGWLVELATGADIQAGKFAEGAERVVFTPAPAGRTTITFNGLGQIVDNAAAPLLPFESIVVTNPGVSGTRPLTVAVLAAGAFTAGTPAMSTGIKICDPHFTYPDPRACP